MSDVKRMFEQDCKDKKNTARSARNVRTHCGKRGGVKFPSDFMTKKEKEAMNGKCESYRMNEPITYEEFKSWPKEHQETYIKLLRQKYNVPLTHISEMMGMDKSTLSWYITRHGLNINDGKKVKTNWDERGFREWCEKSKEKAAQRDFDAEMQKMEDSLKEAFENTFNGTISNEELEELNRMAGETTKAWNETLGNYRPIQEAIDEWKEVERDKIYEIAKQGTCKKESDVYICDNKYHRLPVIPRNGSMAFNNNYADDALTTIRSILGNVKVNLTISWECVE